MADEKVFRPRSISEEEVSSGTLKDVQSIHEMAAKERGETSNFGGGMESSVQISGSPPPGFEKFSKFNNPNPGGFMKKMQKETAFDHVNENLERLIRKASEQAGRYEEVNLPSRGYFYEESIPGTLHVRRMTGEEEQIIASQKYAKEGVLIDKIFRNCISESIDPSKLLTLDRTYLLIFLRGISYSPEYEVQVKCPSCSASFSYSIDLSSLEFDYCKDDFGPANLLGELPISGIKFNYKLSTGADELKIIKYREKRLKDFGSEVTDDTLLYRSSLLITNMEGISQSDEIKIVLKKLIIGDVNYLRNLLTNKPFGVNTNVDVFCPSCGEEFDMELPIESNFFFPRTKGTEKT